MELIYIIIFVLIVVFGLIVINIKAILDKKRIISFYEEKNFSVIKVVKDSLVFGVTNKNGDDYYHIVIKNKNGKLLLKSCQTNSLSGIIEFSSKKKYLCKNCYAIIDNLYTICPECNKTVSK